MEGLIPANRVDLFRDKFKEGSVYTIDRFNLYDAKKSFRSADHPLRICFTQRTTPNEVLPSPENFPRFAYNALPFSVLASRNDDATLLSDVVGLITKLTAILPPSGGTASRKRQVYITDGSETAVVTLWGDYAEQFDAEGLREASNNEPIVILFTGMTVGQFSGLRAFKSTNVTRWHVNIPIPEMATIRESTKHLPSRIEWNGVSQGQADPTESTIEDIAAMEPNDIMGERYKFPIKITEIISTPKSWWYMSCKDCWKKLIYEEEAYRCPRCRVCVPYPRYKLVVRAVDTGAVDLATAKFAEFTFFGSREDTLVGKEAMDVITVSSSQPDAIPVDIQSVIEKEFTVVATPTDKSLDSDYSHFQVHSVEPILRALGSISVSSPSVDNSVTPQPSTVELSPATESSASGATKAGDGTIEIKKTKNQRHQESQSKEEPTVWTRPTSN